MDGLPWMTAPASSCRVMLLTSSNVPVTYVPALKSTVPPPACAQARIALEMASVSSVEPSPLAPKLRTSQTPVLAGAACERSGIGKKAVNDNITGAKLRKRISDLDSCIAEKLGQSSIRGWETPDLFCRAATGTVQATSMNKLDA